MDEKYTKLEGIIKKNGNENMFLIKGDISGIQEFIFNVKGKGAAKTLRGKSAYINFLTLISVIRIIDELELNRDSIIYQGGGNFYILCPYSKINDLCKIKLEILEMLRKEFNGDIYLAIDYVELGIDNILTDISKKWKEVNDKVREKGNKKWEELIRHESNDYFDSFFLIGDAKTENNICPICKENFDDEEHKKIESEDEGKEICEKCNNFKKLAEKLRNSKYLFIEKKLKNNQEEFQILDYCISFSDENKKGKDFKYVYEFNNENSENNLYFPTHTPDNTFNELAEQSNGAKKLGILKLDVDNLGRIFEKKNTLKELIETSIQFKKFFEGKLNELVSRNDYKENVYIIYSGGDDTFIVGSYDKILAFTGLLRKEFDKEFNTNVEEKITFSAGLLIVDKKEAVKSFANKVEDYLEIAKEKGKNGVVIFGEKFSWDEYEQLLKLKETIKTIAETDSRAVLNKIMDSTKGFMSAVNARNLQDKSKKVWRLSYFLRNCTKSKDKVEDLINIYEDLALNRQNKDYTNKAVIPVATRLAEFETRREKENG